MTTPPPAPASSGAFQPLDSIWNHRLLVVLVATVVAVGGTFVAYVKGTAVYRATAVIYVAPRFAHVLDDARELELQSFTQYQQFIQQQTRTIGRYDILLTALQRLGERRFELWQRPEESDREAAERLQRELQVRHVRDTYLITVALESTEPVGLELVVNTVVEVYLERARREEIYASDDRILLLEQQRDQRAERIAELSTQRAELAQALGITTFAEGALNPHDTLLLEVRSALLEAERARIAAAAEQATFDETLGGPSARGALEAAASDLAARDPGLNSLKANLYKRRSELLEQTTGLGRDHPVRRKAERELDDLEAEVQRASAALIADKAAMLLEQRVARAREAETVEQALRARLQAQKEQAAWFASQYNQALTLSHEIARERRALDAIDQRIDFLELESAAPGFMRISTWALEPIEPVAGGRTRLAVLFAAVGGLIGILSALGLDLIDRRVRTTRQVQNLLGFPPLAAFLTPSPEPAQQALLTDQMRRLALALMRERTDQGLRHLLITAARNGCGNTTLVLALARELAALGLRPLVIEVNPLVPDPAYVADPPRPQLMDLVRGAAKPGAAILPADATRPERIGTGTTPSGHLGDYQRIPSLLAELDQTYDVIIFDAAPIRLSADTEYLAGICDAAWLVVRARLALLGEVRGSATRLERAKPPLVGLIMTGLSSFQGGGYYGELLREYRRMLTPARGERHAGGTDALPAPVADSAQTEPTRGPRLAVSRRAGSR